MSKCLCVFISWGVCKRRPPGPRQVQVPAPGANGHVRESSALAHGGQRGQRSHCTLSKSYKTIHSCNLCQKKHSRTGSTVVPILVDPHLKRNVCYICLT